MACGLIPEVFYANILTADKNMRNFFRGYIAHEMIWIAAHENFIKYDISCADTLTVMLQMMMHDLEKIKEENKWIQVLHKYHFAD